jgi:hypothetical protein
MINFNLSLKYYILPYGTNSGALGDIKDFRTAKKPALYRKNGYRSKPSQNIKRQVCLKPCP